MQTTKLSLLVFTLMLITACGKKSNGNIAGLDIKSASDGAVVDQPAQVIVETPAHIGSGVSETLESNTGTVPVEVQITNEGVVVVQTTPEAGQVVADALAAVPSVEVIDESPVLPTPVPPAVVVESPVVEEPAVSIVPGAPSLSIVEVPAVYETITYRDPEVENDTTSNQPTVEAQVPPTTSAQTPAPVVENENDTLDDMNEDNIQESDLDKYKGKSKLLKLFCEKLLHRIHVLEKNLEHWFKNKNNKNDVAIAKATEELKLLKGILEKAERLLK